MKKNLEMINGKEYPQKVIPLIESAKQSIKIIVFDWRFYEKNPCSIVQKFNQSIFRAIRKGVEIKAILNNDYLINLLRKEGGRAKQLKTRKTVHTKMIIIDDKIVILGSHNFSHCAFNVNFELSVILNNIKEKDKFIKYFNNVWQI